MVTAAHFHRHHGKCKHHRRSGEEHQHKKEEGRIDFRSVCPCPEPERRQFRQLGEGNRARDEVDCSDVVRQELLLVNRTGQQNCGNNKRQDADAKSQYPAESGRCMYELIPPVRGVEQRHVSASDAEHLQPVKSNVGNAVSRNTHHKPQCVQERQMPFRALLNDWIQNRRIRRHGVMTQGERVNAPHEGEEKESHRRLGGEQAEQEHREINLPHPPRHQESEEEHEHEDGNEKQQ